MLEEHVNTFGALFLTMPKQIFKQMAQLLTLVIVITTAASAVKVMIRGTVLGLLRYPTFPTLTLLHWIMLATCDHDGLNKIFKMSTLSGC